MAELEQVDAIANPIGDRLRTAREAQGLSLDDIAARTRVPIRHLAHIEKGEWDQLPAPTYSLGFARAYASSVGLNPAEISTELRSQLTATPTPMPSYYEPADPARVPPKWLALVAAVVAIVLIVGYFVWHNDSLGSDEAPPPVEESAIAPAPPPAPTQPVGPPATTTGRVVLTATDEVWVRVSEAGGPRLYEATMKAGDRYEVPATAARPQIQTGRANALRVTIGSTQVPPLGPPETTISNVSLLASDLLARGSAPAAAPANRVPAPPAPAPKANAPAAPAPAAPAVAGEAPPPPPQ